LVGGPKCQIVGKVGGPTELVFHAPRRESPTSASATRQSAASSKDRAALVGASTGYSIISGRPQK
jgi:hypothetical protein